MNEPPVIVAPAFLTTGRVAPVGAEAFLRSVCEEMSDVP
jgi:hypothetical protein